MISKFESLDIEKQKRILNAALKEFARKGFKNASTNEIVKDANISKGLLFHYFSNKKSLFLYLLDYSENIFLNGFYKKFDCDETDIIKRLRQIALLKIDLIQKHSELYEFLISTTTEDSIEIKQDILNRQTMIYSDFYKRLFENIDTSVFKDSFDVKRISEIIFWVAQGFGNRELEKIKQSSCYKLNFDLNTVMGEFDEYIELLKKAFYK